MNKYEIYGWFRYGDNEKEYENAYVIADNEQDAITMFKELYPRKRFFGIDVKKV